MFNSNNKDKQEEFFSDLSARSKKPGKKRFRLARIAVALSYENIIILSIGLIMLLIVCYSLGVEKGRRLAQLRDEDIEVEQEQVQKKPKELAPLPEKKKIKVKVAQIEKISGTSPYIQVASFRTDKYAKKEMQGLKDKGYRPYLTRWGKYRVVCVGGYKNKDEARKALKNLKKLYADCILYDR